MKIAAEESGIASCRKPYPKVKMLVNKIGRGEGARGVYQESDCISNGSEASKSAAKVLEDLHIFVTRDDSLRIIVYGRSY